MKIGVKTNIIAIAEIEPYKVSTIASWALPCFSIWCPGSIERKVSSSGAPKNTDGIKSKKVCVIAIEAMKTTNEINGIASRAVKDEMRITAIRFM